MKLAAATLEILFYGDITPERPADIERRIKDELDMLDGEVLDVEATSTQKRSATVAVKIAFYDETIPMESDMTEADVQRLIDERLP